MGMSLSQGPRLELRQMLGCPKCKKGFFQPSEDVNIFYICDYCGHTLWNGKPPKKGMREHKQV
jgi:hypothetical protein